MLLNNQQIMVSCPLLHNSDVKFYYHVYDDIVMLLGCDHMNGSRTCADCHSRTYREIKDSLRKDPVQ